MTERYSDFEPCGTNLFWRSKDQSYCNMNAFAVDAAAIGLDLDLAIYIDHQADFYRFLGQHKTMTEAEVVAMF